MLPNNVMSFVRKMSTWTLEGTSVGASSEEQKSKMTKIKETIIGRASEKPLKLDISQMTDLTPDELMKIQRVEQRFAEEIKGMSSVSDANEKSCRVCRKRLRDNKDIFMVCRVCQQYLCDDCSSYISEDIPGVFICSRCLLKKTDRSRTPIESKPFSSTDKLDTPVLHDPMQKLTIVHTVARKRSRDAGFVKKTDPEPISSREQEVIVVEHDAKGNKYPMQDRISSQDRTSSQEESDPLFLHKDQQRRPSSVSVRSDSRGGLMSRTSTQDDDTGQDFLLVPEFFTTRRLSDTGPQRINVPEQTRRLSDTGPNRGRLAPQADREREQERRYSEFLATWTGKIPTDRRLSEAGGAKWNDRMPGVGGGGAGGRRMSEAAWAVKPFDMGTKVLVPQEKKIEVTSRDVMRDIGRNKWSLDSGLCPPPKDQRERRLSEGLAAPSRDKERRSSDVGPSRMEGKMVSMSHAVSDSFQDSQCSPLNGSSASESSGAEDYYEDSGRRKSRKIKKKNRIQRQRGNYGSDSRGVRHSNWREAVCQDTGKRVPRQFSKERVNRHPSSGSSDLSDNGPDIVGPPPIPPRRDSQPQIPHFSHFRQRSVHKQTPIFRIEDSDEVGGLINSSPSPEHIGRINMARRMSRGDPRNVYSDNEAMQDDIDLEIKELRKPRHSWPEAENELTLTQGSDLLSALRAQVPSGEYVIPRQSGNNCIKSGESYSDFDKIQIIIHDVDNMENRAQVRQVVLHRDAEDVHRTCGLGMRIIGGKTGSDGHLWTYVAETMPGGPAEVIGISEGDRILAWDGQTLVDRTFEEVNDIIDQSGDIIEIMVEHRSNDLMRNHDTYLTDNHPTTLSDTIPKGTTRRKLPKTPHELFKESVSGKIQLQIWFDKDTGDLTVKVWEARSLRMRTDNTMPQAYVKVRLLRESEKFFFKTLPAEPSCNPSWHTVFVFNLPIGTNIGEWCLDILVWDYKQEKDRVVDFLGETHIKLSEVELAVSPVWYKLNERKIVQTRALRSDVPPSVTSSRRRSLRRTGFQHSRSLSDERDDENETASIAGSMVKSTSVDWSSALRPEYGSERRRSSSGSEKERLEVNNKKVTSLTTNVSPTRTRSKSLKVGKHETVIGGSEQRRKFSQKVKKFSRSLSLKSEKRPVNIGTEIANQDDELEKSDWSRDFLISPPVASGSNWQAPCQQEKMDSGKGNGSNSQ